MTFPEFPTHRLFDFCEKERKNHSVNSVTLNGAGFAPLYLRSGFMSNDMRRWCEMELDFYIWTMQIVWFNDDDDRERFINRFIYPGWMLWKNNHTHGIEVSSADMAALNDTIAQMQHLGAGFTRDMHLFRADGVAEGFEWNPRAYPTKHSVWIGANEHQAMIGKMCGLETLITPSLDSLGGDVAGITPEVGKAVQRRRLLSKYGVTLKDR